MKRKILQYKEESAATFDFEHVDIKQLVCTAKQQAISSTKKLGMTLDSYDDEKLMLNDVVEAVIDDDDEDVGERGEESEEGNDFQYENNDVITINEDCCSLRVQKTNQGGFPVYEKTTSATGTKTRRIYSCVSTTKGSPFIKYKDKFIRKTTALYLIQEKVSVSNDRLLRVRRDHPSHIFSETDAQISDTDYLKCGDLGLFRTVDDSRYTIIGRVVQFSYLRGTKKQREYSSNYVDLRLESKNDIGALCNWYECKRDHDKLSFKTSNIYTIGYVSLENYDLPISDTILTTNVDEGYLFGIQIQDIQRVVPNWKNII